MESGSDSHPQKELKGVAPVLPSRAVPKQGTQQKMRKMPGFLLQTAKQLLALWCHHLRCGDHFSLNQSQHLQGMKGMQRAAWSPLAPSLEAPALPRPCPNSHLTSAGLRHRRVLLAELPLMRRRTRSCVSSWAAMRPPRWADFTSHLPASTPALPFAQVLLPPRRLTLGLSTPLEAKFWT